MNLTDVMDALQDHIDAVRQVSVHGESERLCDLAEDYFERFDSRRFKALFTEAKAHKSQYRDRLFATWMTYTALELLV